MQLIMGTHFVLIFQEFNMNGNGEVTQIQSSNGSLEHDIHTTTPWQMPPSHAEQSAATIAVTRELETLQLFPVKSAPETEPSNMPLHLQYSHQEQPFPFPQFSSSLSCCNDPSFYYQHQSQQVQLQQNQENQCTYTQLPTTTSLELTLGSYFFSPPPPYPGPMWGDGDLISTGCVPVSVLCLLTVLSVKRIAVYDYIKLT